MALIVFLNPDISDANATRYSQCCLCSLLVAEYWHVISVAVAALHLPLSRQPPLRWLPHQLKRLPGVLTPMALWSTIEQNRSPLQITKLICSTSFTVGGCDTLHSLPAADEWFYWSALSNRITPCVYSAILELELIRLFSHSSFLYEKKWLLM